MTFKHLITELESISEAQTRLQSRMMTYQRAAKETVAAYYGLPFDDVDLPYYEWVNLRRKYENETGNQL